MHTCIGLLLLLLLLRREEDLRLRLRSSAAATAMAAALSMTCGVCKAQLRSVQEAQEHAEITGHTDFAESTEPVRLSFAPSSSPPPKSPPGVSFRFISIWCPGAQSRVQDLREAMPH
jgi:hypothetical protein